jgi:hypothetical protein
LITEEMKDGAKMLAAFIIVVLIGSFFVKHLPNLMWIYLLVSVGWFCSYTGKIIKKHYP